MASTLDHSGLPDVDHSGSPDDDHSGSPDGDHSGSPDDDHSGLLDDDHSDSEGSSSDVFDRPASFFLHTPSSRESSPGPFEIIRDVDIAQYRKGVDLPSTDTSTAFPAEQSLDENAISQPSLSSGGSQYNQGNAVSDPPSHDLSLSTGQSPFENGDYAAMNAADFWALYGNGLPATIDLASVTGPEMQDDTDIMDVELDADLDAEHEAGGDELTDLLVKDLEARGDELSAVPHQQDQPMSKDEAAEIAETARREAELQVALQIASEKAKAAIPWSERKDEDLEAELHAELGDPNDDPFGDITSTTKEMTDFEIPEINDLTVKRRSKMRWKPSAKKAAKKAAKRAAQKALKKAAEKTPPNPNPPTTPPSPPPTASEPVVARVGRNQAPPVRRTDELPQLYHLPGTDWNVLRKHMNLSTNVTLKQCYQSLGLDGGRGGSLHQNLRAYLQIPGNSVDLSAKNADTEEAKRIIADIAHKLLYDQRWGQTYFSRPSFASGCKRITYEEHSTEVFLEFSTLLYKAMKLEEKRKKGMAKQREEEETRVVSQHPTSEAFANATYFSPRAASQLLQEQVSATGTHNPPRAIPQPSPVRVSTTGTNNSPRVGLMRQASKAATLTRYFSPHANLQPPPELTLATGAPNSPPVTAQQQPKSGASAIAKYFSPCAGPQPPQGQASGTGVHNTPPAIAQQQPKSAIAKYFSPCTGPQPPPQQVLATGAHNSPPVVAQQQPKSGASAIARYFSPRADHQPSLAQAFVNGAHNPCVAPAHPAELAFPRMQGKRA